MTARNKRWTGAFNIALFLALVALSLPDARSLANISRSEDGPGEMDLEIKLPNDPGGRTPGLVDPGNGGRAGGSRDAANPDDFSVNGPTLRRPLTPVEAVPSDGGLRGLFVRLQQLLFRIIYPTR